MNLTINTRNIQDAVPQEVLKVYTTTTEMGMSAVNIVLYGIVGNDLHLRDMLTDAIDNQHNYYEINRALDEITIYTFIAINGYTYSVR
jgi:hypothetical protein